MDQDKTATHLGYAPTSAGDVRYRMARPADTGDRTPLLCLYDVGTFVFSDIVRTMGTDRWAIATDSPAFDGIAAARPFTAADYAKVVVEVMDHLELGPVDLFGYHGGGCTAFEVARLRPSQVRRLILSSACAFTPEEIAGYDTMFRTAAARSFEQVATDLGREWTNFRRQWRDIPDDRQAWAQFLGNRGNAGKGYPTMQALLAYDTAAALRTNSRPLLVLNPQDDLHEITMRARPLLSHGRMHDFPEWKHGYLNRHADAVAMLLRDFLDAEHKEG